MVLRNIPVNTYLLEVNNKITITRCEICSKLAITTPVLVVLLLILTLNIFYTLLLCFIVNFEDVIVSWDYK